MDEKWKIENAAEMEGALRWLGKRSRATLIIAVGPSYTSVFRGDISEKEAILMIQGILKMLKDKTNCS